MEIIRSLENSRIKLYSSLKMKKYRDKNRLFIIEEKHLIQEALKAERLKQLIIREGVENEFAVEGIYVSDDIMRKLSENNSLNDYIGICEIKQSSLKNDERLIILEDVQDPGNVGTIVRTACCFGYDGVLLSNKCADIYNSKTIAACQGALFSIAIIRDDIKNHLDYCKSHGITLYGTSLKESNYLSAIKPDKRYGLIFGNEGQGISAETLARCNHNFKIEMDSFDSLNVANAMAIASYYFRYHG